MFDFDDVTWILISIGELLRAFLAPLDSIIATFLQLWFG